MAATAQHHTLLKVGGAAVAALAGYEFLYKPWKASQDAALLAATGTTSSILPSSGGGGGGYTLPYITAPTTVGAIQPSNLNPGAAVGGPTGTCMSRKGWTQSQCENRLNGLVAGYQSAAAMLASLQNGTEVATAKASLTANQAALQQAMQAYNQALATGDAAGANQWKAAIDGHNADIAALTAAISGVPGRITQIQSAIAGFIHDYQALTGLTLG